jgi:hypothetical protein
MADKEQSKKLKVEAGQTILVFNNDLLDLLLLCQLE